MAFDETTQPCALVEGREQAERAVARLAAEGIDAAIAAPGSRYHALPPGRWEIRVPATQAARARALLVP